MKKGKKLLTCTSKLYAHSTDWSVACVWLACVKKRLLINQRSVAITLPTRKKSTKTICSIVPRTRNGE